MPQAFGELVAFAYFEWLGLCIILAAIQDDVTIIERCINNTESGV
jgi:hypothetical protein